MQFIYQIRNIGMLNHSFRGPSHNDFQIWRGLNNFFRAFDCQPFESPSVYFQPINAIRFVLELIIQRNAWYLNIIWRMTFFRRSAYKIPATSTFIGRTYNIYKTVGSRPASFLILLFYKE